MANNTLPQILEALNRQEWKQLKKWMRSPSINNRSKVVELLDYLRKKTAYGTKPFPSDKEIYQHLYPDLEFNDGTLRNLTSNLTKGMESFLAYQFWKQQPWGHERHLLSALNAKGLTELAERMVKREVPELDMKSLCFEEEFDNYIHLLYGKAHQSSMKNTKSAGEHMPPIIKITDARFFINKLKQQCKILNHTNVYQGEDVQNVLIEQVLELIGQEEHLSRHPMVRLYRQIHAMLELQSGDDIKWSMSDLLALQATVYKLRDQWTTKGKTDINPIIKKEIDDWYMYLLNFCAKKINKGETQYLQKSFEIQRNAINRKFLLDNNTMPVDLYKNMLVVACRLKAFKWLDKFLVEIKEENLMPFEKNAHLYGMAYLHFNKGKYDKALELIQYIEFKNEFIKHDSSILILKTYFELHLAGKSTYYDSIVSKIKSFKASVKGSNAISQTHRLNYLKFSDILQKLIGILYNRSYHTSEKQTKKLEDIENELKRSKDVADKTWLNKKVKALQSLI